MPSPTSFALFCLASAALAVVPGPAVTYIVMHSVDKGRRAGLASAAGVASGGLVHVAAATVGLSALIASSATAFTAVKLVGAAYLVWLGAHSLHASWRGARTAERRSRRRRLTPGAAFRQGVTSNLGNPKMAVFFTSLLPQFAPESGPRFAAFLVLGLCFCAMTASWLIVYAFAVARAKDVFQRPRIRRLLDGLTGAVLMALGLRLASAER